MSDHDNCGCGWPLKDPKFFLRRWASLHGKQPFQAGTLFAFAMCGSCAIPSEVEKRPDLVEITEEEYVVHEVMAR